MYDSGVVPCFVSTLLQSHKGIYFGSALLGWAWMAEFEIGSVHNVGQGAHTVQVDRT